MQLVYVIELARNTFKDTILYRKEINMNNLEDAVGSKVKNAGHAYMVKHRDPPLVGWLKRNIDVSRLDARR